MRRFLKRLFHKRTLKDLEKEDLWNDGLERGFFEQWEDEHTKHHGKDPEGRDNTGVCDSEDEDYGD